MAQEQKYSLDELNKEQREAVETTDGPLLLLAGAGTGKTKTLTYRIAHLINELKVDQRNILAITFTNKAADEMRHRLSALLGGEIKSMWIYTFHAMCLRMLRKYADHLGYKSNFMIADELDSRQIIRRILADFNIDSKRFEPKLIKSQISSAKNELIGPEEYSKSAASGFEGVVAKIYTAYQQRLQSSALMDFDDLLMNTYYLLSTNSEAREHYQTRWQYISVDEYQDTNRAQYEICKALAQKHRNFMVVGDDDQSIYGWRGADMTNILSFEKDWPDAKVLKLTTNYRSTQHILNAANSLIAHNSQRYAKALVAHNETSQQLVQVYRARDESDEARVVANAVEQQHEQKSNYSEIAILYRTNSQSRVFEEVLLRAGIPYKIVGGVRFFERKEIRDLIAYLHLCVNPYDNNALLRISSVPKGIREQAMSSGLTYLETFEQMDGTNDFPARTSKLSIERLRSLSVLIHKLHQSALQTKIDLKPSNNKSAQDSGQVSEFVQEVLEASNLIELYRTEEKDEEKLMSRIENLKEFLNVVSEFEEDKLPGNWPQNVAEALELFGEWVSLRSDLDTLQESDDYVVLMTVHAAKGLEFASVFVTGLEEETFPHMLALREDIEAEEERRLAYVAMTRAKDYLFLSHANKRREFFSRKSQSSPKKRSRYLDEIPDSCFEQYKEAGSASYAGSNNSSRSSRHRKNLREGVAARVDLASFAKGDKVFHKVFGQGIIDSIKGDAIDVCFNDSGQIRKLMLGFAPIVKMD